MSIITTPLPKFKAAKSTVKDVDASKQEATFAYATYNTRDRDKDRANMGMFSKSWNEFKDTRLFLNHIKEQTPGTILKMWEDQNHAYAQMQFGDWTLGVDTFKMIQAGAIKDCSYHFVATKYDKFNDGGYDFKEALLKEVSPLTHWGAHPESKVISVSKDGDPLSMESLKSLSSSEITFIRDYINSLNIGLTDLITFSATLPETSDVYTWVNDIISSISYIIQRFKYQVVWGQKSWSEADLKDRLTRLKSFCKDTDASDTCIQNVLKEADEIELILGAFDSTVAADKALQQQKGFTEGDKLALELFNLQQILAK